MATLTGVKRKLDADSAGGAGGGSGDGMAPPSTTFTLEERHASMTVEQFLRGVLADLVAKCNESVDDAVDTVSLTYKQLREELQEHRHVQRAAAMAKTKAKAARQPVWDVQLTVEETAEDCEDLLGKVFLVQPRQSGDRSGMCKLGRSTGDDFLGSRGVSLSRDFSVSTWHGKLTSVWGVIYYTDLNTKNGSRINGARIERDTPTQLHNGDRLSLGDTTLRVLLIPAVVAGGEDEDEE